MSDFIWRPSKFQDVPTLLRSTVRGFGDSPAYRGLREYERDISGVVAGAFAKYLCCLHERKNAGEITDDLQNRITSAHDAIEAMTASGESSILDLVTDEIFENLDCKPEVEAEIRKCLKPASSALYSRWKK